MFDELIDPKTNNPYQKTTIQIYKPPYDPNIKFPYGHLSLENKKFIADFVVKNFQQPEHV